MSKPTNTAPERIWLGIDEAWRGCRVCGEGFEAVITDHSYPDAIEYIRADLHTAALERVEQLQADNQAKDERIQRAIQMLCSYEEYPCLETVEESVRALLPELSSEH
jgi:hypothetical protein